MSALSMLEQLLKAGSGLLAGQGAAPGQQSKAGLDWRQLSGGAAAGGAIGLLLGSKRGRSYGGKALKYGSLAALGVLAYRAYGNWQAQQQNKLPAAPLPTAAPAALAPPDRLKLGDGTAPAPDDELRSRALLQAMLAASKSDGHLDERERALLEAEMHRLESDPALRQWLDAELQRPLDPAQVALAATSTPLAAEMYLASLLVVDETSFMERAYLDELAREMGLPEGLKRELEAQARAGN